MLHYWPYHDSEIHDPEVKKPTFHKDLRGLFVVHVTQLATTHDCNLHYTISAYR